MSNPPASMGEEHVIAVFCVGGTLMSRHFRNHWHHEWIVQYDGWLIQWYQNRQYWWCETFFSFIWICFCCHVFISSASPSAQQPELIRLTGWPEWTFMVDTNPRPITPTCGSDDLCHGIGRQSNNIYRYKCFKHHSVLDMFHCRLYQLYLETRNNLLIHYGIFKPSWICQMDSCFLCN